MTIPMDAAVSLTTGHAFAIAARDAVSDDPDRARACLRRGRLFTTLVFVPLGLYFWVRWPDWTWMYIAGRRSRSLPVTALGYCCYLVAHELGYRNAARLIEDGRTDEAVIHCAASLSVLALISAFGWRRFRWQGTAAEFEAGTAVDVLSSRDFRMSMLVTGTIFFGAAAAVVVKNRS
jgi:hypothetical protein